MHRDAIAREAEKLFRDSDAREELEKRRVEYCAESDALADLVPSGRGSRGAPSAGYSIAEKYMILARLRDSAHPGLVPLWPDDAGRELIYQLALEQTMREISDAMLAGILDDVRRDLEARLELWSAEQAAQTYQRSVSHFRSKVGDEIPCVRSGSSGARLMRRSDVEEYAKRHGIARRR